MSDSEEGRTSIGNNTGSYSEPNTTRGSGSVFSGLGLRSSSNNSYTNNSFAFGDNALLSSDSFTPRETTRDLLLPSLPHSSSRFNFGSGSLLGIASASGMESVRCMQCGRYEVLSEPLEAALAAHHRCESCLNGESDSLSRQDPWR